MTTSFDNQAFLDSLGPNIDMIKKLTTQKNWAIGIASTLAIATGVLAIIVYKKQKKVTALLASINSQPASSPAIPSN